MQHLSNKQAIRLQKFLMAHALRIVLKKRQDYSGTEDPFRNLRSAEVHGVEPWRGTLVRLQDKLSRIRSIMDAGGVMNVEEAMIDTFADIINYSCILAGLVWETLELEMPEDR